MLNQIAHEPKTPAGGMYAPDYWHPKVVLSYPQKGMVTVKLFKAGNTNPIWNQEYAHNNFERFLIFDLKVKTYFSTRYWSSHFYFDCISNENRVKFASKSC